MSTENNTPSVATLAKCPQLAGKQFKKGVSGNPGGRPKKKPVTEIFDEIVATPEEREKIKRSVIAMLALRDHVSVSMLHEMADRIEGKPAGSAPEIDINAREIIVQILGVNS